MAEFLEERISERIRFSSDYVESFAVTRTETAGGSSYARLVHPIPRRVFTVSFVEQVDVAWAQIADLYMRAHGQFAGFRLRCYDEWSTQGLTGTPTANDQPAALVSPGVYQLQKRYGTGAAASGIGYPVRTIFKPVAGTVKVGVGGFAVLSFVVDTTTGQFTFFTDVQHTITGITNAAQAVITLGTHPHAVGETVHISGVGGMTQINGLRALIVAVGANDITVDVDTSGFSTYTSGGVANTRPQTGETVTAGCEFDFPVHFATDLRVGQNWPKYRAIEQMQLVELLNP